MKSFHTALVLTAFMALVSVSLAAKVKQTKIFSAADKKFQYCGRVDFTDREKPRFWASGVCVKARFTGTTCDVLLNDEVRYGNQHNFVEIILDEKPPVRIQTTEHQNTISLPGELFPNLSDGPHTLTVCKDTEPNIGYVEFVGLRCKTLLPPPAPPTRKIEFIGDSITAGYGNDASHTPCGTGDWYVQNNAWESYGPMTARALNAQWHLSAVPGLGMVHSCCSIPYALPDVYEKTSLEKDGPMWDSHRYQPDVVTVCLGQNDGLIDEKAFAEGYALFLTRLRTNYPKAKIVCLTSPMADAGLQSGLEKRLLQVVERRHSAGDANVTTFFFTGHFNSGCSSHPSIAEHRRIAEQLTAFLQKTMRW